MDISIYEDDLKVFATCTELQLLESCFDKHWDEDPLEQGFLPGPDSAFRKASELRFGRLEPKFPGWAFFVLRLGFIDIALPRSDILGIVRQYHAGTAPRDLKFPDGVENPWRTTKMLTAQDIKILRLAEGYRTVRTMFGPISILDWHPYGSPNWLGTLLDNGAVQDFSFGEQFNGIWRFEKKIPDCPCGGWMIDLEPGVALEVNPPRTRTVCKKCGKTSTRAI